MTTADFALLHI